MVSYDGRRQRGLTNLYLNDGISKLDEAVAMIEAIVAIYRAAVVALFAFAVLFAGLIFLSSAGSGYGFLASVGVLAFAAITLGISAVLLSINDRLGQLLATGGSPTAGEGPQQGIAVKAGAGRPGRSYVLVAVIIFAILAAMAVTWRGRSSDQVSDNQIAENGFNTGSEDPNYKLGQPRALREIEPSDDPMCDPKLAAKVGLRCAPEKAGPATPPQ